MTDSDDEGWFNAISVGYGYGKNTCSASYVFYIAYVEILLLKLSSGFWEGSHKFTD